MFAAKILLIQSNIVILSLDVDRAMAPKAGWGREPENFLLHFQRFDLQKIDRPFGGTCFYSYFFSTSFNSFRVIANGRLVVAAVVQLPEIWTKRFFSTFQSPQTFARFFNAQVLRLSWKIILAYPSRAWVIR